MEVLCFQHVGRFKPISNTFVKALRWTEQWTIWHQIKENLSFPPLIFSLVRLIISDVSQWPVIVVFAPGERQGDKRRSEVLCLVRCLLKWSLAPSHYSAAPYMFEPFSDVYLFMIQFYILHQLCHLKNLSHLDLWDCLGMRGTLVSGEIALLHDK